MNTVNPVGPDRPAGRMEISHEATKGANPVGPDRRAGRLAIGPYRMGVGSSTLLRGTAAVVLGMALCVLLSAGCSGGREDGDAAATRRDAASPPPAAETADAQERIPPKTPMRREFVILRELVKQHAKQTEVGNAERLAIVDRNLRERLVALPDEGLTEDEREVLREARRLYKP